MKKILLFFTILIFSANSSLGVEESLSYPLPAENISKEKKPNTVIIVVPENGEVKTFGGDDNTPPTVIVSTPTKTSNKGELLNTITKITGILTTIIGN